MRLVALVVGALVFVADMVTKWWVANTPQLHYYQVIDGILTINYVHNEGIAFGLLHSFESEWKPLLLSVMAIVATVVVLYYICRTPEHERFTLIALGFLLGGILGNFTDRLAHQYVVDFIKIHWGNAFAWPTFNVADSAITGGVLLIIAESLFRRKAPTHSAPAAGSDTPAVDR